MRRVTGAPKVSPTRIGVKNAAQASIALSSTGISMTMPRTRSGACDGDLERRVGAQRGAADHRLIELEVVHERQHLLAERAHRVAPHVARAVRAPVAEQVEQDDAVAAVGQRLGQRARACAPEAAARGAGSPLADRSRTSGTRGAFPGAGSSP